MLSLRRGPGTFYRKLRSLEYLATRDRAAAARFLFPRRLGHASQAQRLDLVRRFVSVTNAVRGYHTLTEMLAIATAILEAGPRPTVLEAGCGYGASTAKISLAVKLAGGSLVACDSFRGIPENEEEHELLDGRRTEFRAGAFRGTLASVERVVERWGAADVCRFEKGWFEETLPRLDAVLDVVVADVDLTASLRTCIRELWPRLRRGGVFFALDGQLRATHDLLGNARFWREEVGVEPPAVAGLDSEKMLKLRRV
jgi:O-methyltransferase